MFCQSCGSAITQPTKYCNRCGALLNKSESTDLIKLFEERMDSEMEGLFWTTILGTGLILGGTVLMKKVGLDNWLIIGYLFLSAAAFITYFGLGVWQVRRLAKKTKETDPAELTSQLDTHELGPAPISASFGVPSITEHTTRTLEPTSQDERLK